MDRLVGHSLLLPPCAGFTLSPPSGWSLINNPILIIQHVLVIGPGLGRSEHMQNCARVAFELAREMDQISIVVDADGLFLVQVGWTLWSLSRPSTGVSQAYANVTERPSSGHGLAGCPADHPHSQRHGI
jgi:hypothetical protein